MGATATAGSFAAAGLTSSFVGVALTTDALNVLPPIVFEYSILWLGSLATPLLVASITLCTVGAFRVTAGVAGSATVGQSPAVRGSAVFL